MLENIFAYLTAGAVAMSSLTGCIQYTNNQVSAESDTQTAQQTSAEVSAYAQFTAEYSDRDCDGTYDESSAVKITLSGSSAQVSGSGAEVSGSTITITSGGTYILSGTLSGGSVIIDAPETEKVQLVLSGADITSADGPAIYEKQCDKLFVTLVGSNKLSDSANYTLAEGEDEPNAALFAKHDMTINGSGTLTVNGAYKHGILSKDDLKITGGEISVTSAEDGIRGRDSVYIKDGVVNVTAGGDGIQSNNDTAEDKGRISVDGGTVTITAANDGIQAESVLQINGGTINIKSGNEENAPSKTGSMGGGKGGMGGGMRGNGGNRQAPPDGMTQGGNRPTSPDGMTQNANRPTPPDMQNVPPQQNAQTGASAEQTTESKKALKSANALYINGGDMTVSAEDDAVHANVKTEINDGTLSISTADDAVHADYECIVNGGTLNISKCYEGLEGKTVVVNGGAVDITASDDGINASDPTVTNARPGGGSSDVYIKINGGTVKVVSASDSLDSNGDVYISGGSITLDGPSMSADCALDFDGKAYIYGGTLAASGAAAGSQLFDSTSEQPSLMMIFSSQQTEGTAAQLYDASGALIAEVTPTRAYGGVVFSSPLMKKGETYTVKAGSVSASVTLNDTATAVSDTGAAVTGGKGGMNGMGGARPDKGNGGGRGDMNRQTAQ